MRHRGKAAVGILLSVALLWWTLRDVSLAAMWRELRQADPWLFLLSVTIATAGLVPRAVRWGILLRPAAPALGFRPRFAATSIGFAANNLLPARIGEFARAFSLSRLSRVSAPAAFGSLVIERVLDGLVVVALLFLAIATPGFPRLDPLGINLRAAAVVVVAAMGAVGALLFLMVVAPRRAMDAIEWIAERSLPMRPRRLLLDASHAFIRGLAALRDGRLFLLSLAWAVGQWLFLALSFWFAFLAFGIDEAGFVAAIFLQSLIALAVAIPSSPGFFGPFEAAAKLGLGLWDVPAEKAVSFAVGFHIGGFIPVTLIGIFYAWRLGLSWREVQHSEEVVEQEVGRGVPRGAERTEAGRGGEPPSGVHEEARRD